MGAVTPETCRVILQWINICILLHLLDFYSHWRRYSSDTVRILWNPKSHYHVLKPDESNSCHSSPYCEVLLNVISLCMPTFPSWSLSPMFHNQNSICIFVLPLVFYMYWTSLSPCFCQFNSAWRELKSLRFYLRSFSVARHFFMRKNVCEWRRHAYVSCIVVLRCPFASLVYQVNGQTDGVCSAVKEVLFHYRS